MAGFWNRLKLFDKVLIVSGTSVLLTFSTYLFFTYHPPRHFILPEGFSGWVTIKYEKPGAPPLKREGKVQIFEIPPTGILETSERFDFGWGKDVFFRQTPSGLVRIPDMLDGKSGPESWIHRKSSAYPKLDSILLTLGKDVDTTLFDGSEVEMQGDTANVRPGRKLLQHFYVAPRPEGMEFRPPDMPRDREWW